MNKNGFKFSNDNHGTIYCNFMLLSTVTSTLKNDALAMRLASWMKVPTTTPQLPKPKPSYEKPQYDVRNILLYAIKKRKRRGYVAYQMNWRFSFNNGVVYQSTLILCRMEKYHTQQLLVAWQEGMAASFDLP